MTAPPTGRVPPARTAAAWVVGAGSHPESPLERRGALAALLMMGWLTAVLVVDHDGSHATQRVLGGLTWLVLLGALRVAVPLVRVQALVVVAFATVVEYTFSPGLEVYLYRFGGVPSYVPPGHGLVYLSAFALGHDPWVRARLRPLGLAVLTALGAWAVWALLGPPHRRARRVLVRLPARVLAVGPLARGVRRRGGRGDLAGAGRHAPGHLGLADQ